MYVLPWIWSILWIKPRFVKSMSVCAKWSKFDSLFLLLISLFLIPILYLWFERAMNWIININIGSWTWSHWFYLFIYISFITTIKCSMDSFFSYNFILNIIFFFLMVILSWAWIFCISLSCKGSFNFIFPKFTSSSFWKKRLWLLSNKLTIIVLFNMIVCCFFYWYFSFISTWSGNLLFNFCIFAIWNFWLKYFVFSCWIELFLPKFFIIINSWARIICPTHIIVSIISLLK